MSVRLVLSNNLFIKQILSLFNKLERLLVGNDGLKRVYLLVRLEVCDLVVVPLDQLRDCFKSVESVVRVVQHDSVEDLREVLIQILPNRRAQILRLPQLVLDEV